MRRPEFDHVIGAAENIAGLDSFDEPPVDMLESMEVDLYPPRRPDRASEVEGEIGDGSQFHSTYGCFAHAVGPETAKAPAGWEERLIPVAVLPRVGSDRSPVAYCLDRTTLCSRSALVRAS